MPLISSGVVLGTITSELRVSRLACGVEGGAARLLTKMLRTRSLFSKNRLKVIATLPLTQLRGVVDVVCQRSTLDGLARRQRTAAEHMRSCCAVDLVRMAAKFHKPRLGCQLCDVHSGPTPGAGHGDVGTSTVRMKLQQEQEEDPEGARGEASSQAAMKHAQLRLMMASRCLLLRRVQSLR